jgi:hypothetical protein
MLESVLKEHSKFKNQPPSSLRKIGINWDEFEWLDSYFNLNLLYFTLIYSPCDEIFC